ncbi:ATP-binding cassette domain-containing protein [Ruminococcaceae bacterium OttesenSCG-928-I18]|nr:ATP-binding cassette domain-containing protein [Ruminococcaceae bacterium OttesenSCG-928-I18]
MSLIQILDLSFTYPGALSPVFSHVHLELDTLWRLGLIGRNGRGKTTFLNLLLGKLQGTGEILSAEVFEYFPLSPVERGEGALSVARSVIAPFDEWEEKMRLLMQEGSEQAIRKYGEIESAYSAADGYVIDELIRAECGKLEVPAEALDRPYSSLSGGERVKLLLAALFLKKHRFLLIDEPTDHLDANGRRTVARWLRSKQGFILVSHDRAFLDEAIDHVLSINRADIELQRGNYSTWRHNRTQRDEFEKAENRKLEAGISRLKEAAARTEKWSDKIEKSKKNSRSATYDKGPASVDRGYIGHQAARMMQRSKSIEKRRARDIEEKEKLLKNVEDVEPLKFHLLPPDKKRLLTAEDIGVRYGDRTLFSHLDFDLDEGDRMVVRGANGSGKSTLLRLILGEQEPTKGTLRRMGGLVVSTLPQETDFLQGSLRIFAQHMGVEESLFLALLRKLDFSREAFGQSMESYSAGQKKKVCLAASLAKPAHLFVWDEPLNYIDVLSREQVEKAVLDSAPTMIFVEHDAVFTRSVATKELVL